MTEPDELLAQVLPPDASLRRTAWTATDLLAAEFREPRFAVNGLLPEGLTFACGAPKLGKSWMGLGLGIAVASGGKALGHIDVERGNVLYLALEDSPRRLQARLRILLPHGDAPEGLDIATEWPRLDEGGTDALDQWIERHAEARLVVIDVWPRIRPRQTKRTDFYQADYDAAAPLQGVAISRGIAVVVIHHTRKAEADDFVQLAQGTFGTAAAADTIVVIKRARGQADATLLVTGRDVEEQELALRFEAQAGAWRLLGDASEYALGETRRELLEVVKVHGTLTPKQAAELTGINYELVKRTMHRMADAGQLAAHQGRYSYSSPVPPVPLSPEERDRGTAGTPLPNAESAAALAALSNQGVEYEEVERGPSHRT